MSPDTDALRGDLAFLRALVEPNDAGQRVFGEGYLAGGVCYGGQLLLNAGQILGVLPASGLVSLTIGVAPTVVFVAALAWILGRNRGNAARGGLTGRAIGGLFATLGLANLALAVVIGWVAISERSITVWLIYPCAVFVLQGHAWFAALILRRRAWYGLVGAGWFAAGIGMGFAVHNLAWYVGLAGAGMVFCMALPGWLIMRGVASAPASATQTA